MRYIKRFTAYISAFALVLALCAGCAKTNETPEDVTAFAPVAEELPLPEEYTGEGKVTELKTTMMRNPETLHPIYVTDEDTLNLMSLICEPAIALDSTDKPGASVIENWVFDESGQSVVFNVRKDVFYHDGSKVTAYDIKYCLDLIMTASETECIYAKYKNIISAYEAVDEYTLKLDMTMKTGDIYYLMNFPVISESVYSSRPPKTNSIPIGTGPYKVVSYTVDGGMELELNEAWWRTLPSIKRVTASAVEDNESKLAGYQMGEYNFVAMTTMTANSYRAQKNTSTYKTATLYYEAIIPNINNRFLQDVSVRRAISLALDRREIISTGVLSGGIAATTPIRANKWYIEGTTGELIEYDVAKSNSILDEADYFMDSGKQKRYVPNADGSRGYMKFELIYCEYDELYYRNTVASLIKSDLEEVGIEIEVRELERAEFVKALENGDFDLALASFYTKENDDLGYLFGYSSNCNYGGYMDEEMQSRISSCRMALTEEEYKTAYTSLNNLLAERLPHIGLYFKENLVYSVADIENITNLRRGAVFADINSWE